MSDASTSGLSSYEKQLIRDKARWMSLDYEAVSPEALALVEKLRIIKEGDRSSSTRKSRFAMGAILGDLLAAQIGKFWSIRSLRSGSYTGLRAGYGFFIEAFEHLENLSLIERLEGYTTRSGFGATGRATCFRLTPKGLETVLEAGINPDTSFAAHFKKTQGKKDP